MSDEPTPPTTSSGRGPAAPAPEAAPRRSGGQGGAFAAIAIVALLAAGGIYWTWANPRPDDQAMDAARQAQAAAQDARQAAQTNQDDLTKRVGALEGQIAALRQAQDKLSGEVGQSAAGTAAMEALGRRVAALETQAGELSRHVEQLAGTAQGEASAQDLAALSQKVDALARQAQGEPSGQDIAALAQKVDALEKQGQGAASAQDVAALGQKLDALAQGAAQAKTLAALSQRVDQVEERLGGALSRQQDALSAVAGKVREADQSAQQTRQQLGQEVQALRQDTSGVDTRLKRAAWLARLQAARAALDQGQPLGRIEGAPPAIARFAASKPPTLASLREGFPAMAASVHRAHQNAASDRPWYDRALAHLEDTVTLRKGGSVLLGDPAAGPLAEAHAALNADDLEGTVRALDKLQGGAARAAAPFRDQVQSVLDARAALAAMMAHA
jgi:hypothetical protein